MLTTTLHNLSTKDITLQVQSRNDGKYYLLQQRNKYLADRTQISQNTYYQLLTEDMNYREGTINER